MKKGQSYNSGNYRYKVLNVSKKTVAVTKTLKASKTIKVPNTVKIKGKTFKGTAKKIKVDVPNSKKKAYKKLFKKNSGISSKAVFK